MSDRVRGVPSRAGLPRGYKNRLALLVPNTDRDILGLIFEVVKGLGVSIDQVMPEGVDEDDIMQIENGNYQLAHFLALTLKGFLQKVRHFLDRVRVVLRSGRLRKLALSLRY